ncbi:MAG: hypothetical protein RIA63_10870, partial [Cyclobacteriaceae bacterium]
MLKVLMLTLSGFVAINAWCQSDTRSFASLNLPTTAELSALGGVNVSRADYNSNFFQNNPSLSSDSLDGWASANYLFYFAGTGLASFAYQHDFGGIGSLSFA